MEESTYQRESYGEDNDGDEAKETGDPVDAKNNIRCVY